MISVSRVVNSSEFRRRAMIYLAYFGFLIGLGFLRYSYFVILKWSTLLFLFGGVLGMVSELFDRLVYVYYSKPKEELSLEVKGLIQQKKYAEAVEVLYRKRHLQQRLAMNNVLFLAVWVVLSLFLITSSPSVFGRGMVLGLGLNLVFQIYEDWDHKQVLRQRLFWPIKREISDQEMKLVLAVFVAAFALFSLTVVY